MDNAIKQAADIKKQKDRLWKPKRHNSISPLRYGLPKVPGIFLRIEIIVVSLVHVFSVFALWIFCAVESYKLWNKNTNNFIKDEEEREKARQSRKAEENGNGGRDGENQNGGRDGDRGDGDRSSRKNAGKNDSGRKKVNTAALFRGEFGGDNPQEGDVSAEQPSSKEKNGKPKSSTAKSDSVKSSDKIVKSDAPSIWARTHGMRKYVCYLYDTTFTFVLALCHLIWVITFGFADISNSKWKFLYVFSLYQSVLSALLYLHARIFYLVLFRPEKKKVPEGIVSGAGLGAETNKTEKTENNTEADKSSDKTEADNNTEASDGRSGLTKRQRARKAVDSKLRADEEERQSLLKEQREKELLNEQLRIEDANRRAQALAEANAARAANPRAPPVG
jgi:hypothetical protein